MRPVHPSRCRPRADPPCGDARPAPTCGFPARRGLVVWLRRYGCSSGPLTCESAVRPRAAPLPSRRAADRARPASTCGSPARWDLVVRLRRCGCLPGPLTCESAVHPLRPSRRRTHDKDPSGRSRAAKRPFGSLSCWRTSGSVRILRIVTAASGAFCCGCSFVLRLGRRGMQLLPSKRRGVGPALDLGSRCYNAVAREMMAYYSIFRKYVSSVDEAH